MMTSLTFFQAIDFSRKTSCLETDDNTYYRETLPPLDTLIEENDEGLPTGPHEPLTIEGSGAFGLPSSLAIVCAGAFAANTLELYDSLGYDSAKRSNLFVVSPDTIMFAQGNMVQFLNVRTQAKKYLWTAVG